MKYKKSIIFIFLVICFLSIAGVWASDTEDMNVQTGNDTIEDVVALDEANCEDVSGDVVALDKEDNRGMVAINDVNDELQFGRSFDYLQGLIDDADEGDEILLNDDYSFLTGGDTIKISKSITINGNGHTLSGDSLKRIISIEKNGISIVFKNIKFKNGGLKNSAFEYSDDRGGAILNPFIKTHLTIINCDFRHNGVHKYGGAIYTNGKLKITDSKFFKNVAVFGNGGAIYCTGELEINNTDFNGNEIRENDNSWYAIMKIDGYNMINYLYYADCEELIRFDDHDVVKEIYENFRKKVDDPDLQGDIIPMSGGAIYCSETCTIRDSNFQSNVVGINNEQIATSGGAIHSIGFLYIYNTTFEENEVNDWGGGAIFSQGHCFIFNSTFEDNTANKGCAIYATGEIYVFNSEFSSNIHKSGTTWLESVIGESLSLLLGEIDEYHILDVVQLPTLSFLTSDGGAIWAGHDCHIDSCRFDNNFVYGPGGAVYSKGNLTVTGESIFNNNQVITLEFFNKFKIGFEKNGGAIYCCGNLFTDNAYFLHNSASNYGGAIYCEKECNLNNTKFSNNILEGTFLVNSHGAAVYTEILGTVNNCSFDNNRADVIGYNGFFNKGGSIYINGKCNPNIINSIFEANVAYESGGAIYFDSKDSNLIVTNCTFNKNKVSADGGAIYSEGKITISNSTFKDNRGTGADKLERSFGGAIRSKKLIIVTNCVFENNYAYNLGGAIYADDEIRMVDFNNFTGNSAKEGGAVYASFFRQEVSNSFFTNNRATDGSGGAIYILHHCDPSFITCTFRQNTCTDKGGAIHLDGYTGTLKVSYSKFDGNNAGQYGGAIYTNYLVNEHTKTDISNSYFTTNTAKEGGAVYTSEIIQVSNSEFLRNKATSGNGGGVYVNNKCSPKFSSCIFEDNTCTKHGGAIYLDGYGDYLTISYSTFNGNHAGGNGGATYANYIAGSTYSKTEINNCTFTSNSANMGGAVFTCEIPKTVSKSTFVGNKATGGDGGAVYINNKCNPEFVSCRFEQNNAYDTGGAIYLDSFESHLKVSYCTFVGNHADKKKYSGAKRHAAGHSIFNKGYYDFLDLCWLGKNDINKDDLDQQFVECKAGADDKDHAPHNTYKIGIKLNETDIYERNNYEATIYFYGADLNNELLHSTGRFYGDGNFSNVDAAGPNDMTADVNFIRGPHTIYGKLDNQVVSLTIITRVKSPNIVEIISCVGRSYPNGVSVKFESLYGVPEEGAIYVIKDMQENVVRQGKINPIYRDFTENALLPGNYSVTVIVPEQRHYLEGSATATFEIAKGDCYGEIILNDVTYPSRVDMYISAMLNVNWNFTITGDLGTVTSRIIRITEDDVVPYDDDPDASMRHYGYPIYLGTMDPGEYEVTLTHEEDNIYKHYLTFSVFRVHSNGTAFEIEANPHVITLGENATVTHVLPENATGKIKYYFKNGTFLGEASVSENFTLHILNAGSHIIVGNYSGDSTHIPQSDLTYILVKKAKPEFQVGTDTIRYGKRATVTHELPLGAEGTIKYYLLNGTFLGELPANESFVLPVWNVGSYVIVADYSGDGNFLDATANTTLTILDSIETQLTTSPVFTVYKDNDYLLIKLEDVNNKPIADAIVTVDLNGNKNYTTDADGQIEISTSNLGAGTYDVYVTFDGMGEYRNCSTVTQVFINSRPSIMTVTPLTTIYQVHKYLMVNLKDDTGRPISGVEVFTVIHGVTYKATTDSNGDGRLIIRLDPMDYVATVVLDNENYTISFEQARVLVYKADPKIIAKSKKFKANKKVKKYTITLRDNIGKAIKNAKVTLKIKGKIYVAKTNSQGKATFKIKKLTKKGNYKATVTFEGNFYFNKVTKNVKITCSK